MNQKVVLEDFSRNFFSKRKIEKEKDGKEKSKNSQKNYKDNKNNVQRKSVKKYFKKNENWF